MAKKLSLVGFRKDISVPGSGYVAMDNVSFSQGEGAKKEEKRHMLHLGWGGGEWGGVQQRNHV